MASAQTPEERHLHEQQQVLAELSERLAEQEAAFATAGARFAVFRSEYLARFAPLYAGLDSLEAEIASLIADKAGTADARANAERAAQQARESATAAGAHGEQEAIAPTDELRSLYRRLAKLVHPDLAATDEERSRRTRLMASASEAYRCGDAAQLQRLIESEAARPEAVVGANVGADLVRVIRQIAQVQRRFEELVELQKGLEGDPLWRLFVRVDSAEGPAMLDQVEAGLQRQIASARARLAGLRQGRRE